MTTEQTPFADEDHEMQLKASVTIHIKIHKIHSIDIVP